MKTNLKVATFASLACVYGFVSSTQGYAEVLPANVSSKDSASVAEVDGGLHGDAGMSAAGTSTTAPEVKTTLTSSLKERIALNYWGVFAGPSLSRSISPRFNPSISGEPGDPIGVDGYITAGYRPAKNLMVGLGVPFLYQPVDPSEKLIMKDLFVRFSRKKLISYGKLNMSLGARVFLPTTQVARDRAFTGGLRVEQDTTYDITDRLQLATYTFFRGNVYGEQANGAGNPLTIYAAPYLTYKMSNSLSLTLWCDLIQYKSTRNKEPMKNDPVDIQPGISWDVTENISLNPYVNFYPGNLSWESSSVGMILSATAL